MSLHRPWGESNFREEVLDALIHEGKGQNRQHSGVGRVLMRRLTATDQEARGRSDLRTVLKASREFAGDRAAVSGLGFELAVLDRDAAAEHHP